MFQSVDDDLCVERRGRVPSFVIMTPGTLACRILCELRS